MELSTSEEFELFGLFLFTGLGIGALYVYGSHDVLGQLTGVGSSELEFRLELSQDLLGLTGSCNFERGLFEKRELELRENLGLLDPGLDLSWMLKSGTRRD